MNLTEIFRNPKLALVEGGNLEIDNPNFDPNQPESPTNTRVIQAQEIQLAPTEISDEVQDRTHMVGVLKNLFMDINKTFTVIYKTPLFNPAILDKEIKDFMAGSSQHFFDLLRPNPNFNPKQPESENNPKMIGLSDEEFKKYKPKVGDIDIQCNQDLKEQLLEFLTNHINVPIGNETLLGAPSAGNEQYNTLWQLADPPIKLQIDFEYGKYSPITQKPDEWTKFSHSSAWEDIQQNIKGVFHKYIYRALAKAAPEAKYIAKLTGLGKKRAMGLFGGADGKEQFTDVNNPPAPFIDANFSFSVASKGGGGVRAKYKPVEPGAGIPTEINGLPVMHELKSGDSEYEQDLNKQFVLFFGKAPQGNDRSLQNSFLGTLDLMNKYLDDNGKRNAASDFFDIVFEPGSQMLTKGDPQRDYATKFAAIDKMLAVLGLEDMKQTAETMAQEYEQDYNDVEAFRQANPNEKQPRAAMRKQRELVKEDAQVKAQFRKGMPHLHDLKPADLLDLLDEIHDGNGSFKLQNIPLNVKVDGFGGRFGKNSEGKPFMGTSRTEPRYAPGFVAYHEKKGTTDPEVLGRAKLFDELFNEMMNAVQLVDSKLGPGFLVNKQVTCEVLYLPFATETPEGKLKFVGIHYDKLPAGVTLALVPFRITDATTGEDLPNSNKIIKELISAGKSGSIMFIDNSLTQNEALDVTALVPPVENIDELKAMLASNKLEARRQVKAALEPVAAALEKAIINDPNIIGKDLLGQDYEGIVINSRLGPIKVTSQEQRDVITAKNAAKVNARTERPRGEAKTAVVAVGSFVGHIGHQELFKLTIDKAKSLGGDPYLFMGNRIGVNDPIPINDKLKTWKMLYPQYANNISAMTEPGGSLIQKIKHELINPLPGKPPRYDNVIIMTGEEEDEDENAGKRKWPSVLMKAVNKFQGYEHVKSSIEFTTRGTGISFTQLRNMLKTKTPEQAFAAWSNAFNAGKSGAQPLPPDWIKHLMDVSRTGMKIQEPQHPAQQKQPGPQTPAPQEMNEDVGGNYLYHATGGLKKILSTGRIFPAHGPQDATKAQTTSTTVSTTRDWNYASGGESETQGVDSNAVIVLDRNAVESNFKTLGTSQSKDVRGLAHPQQKNLDAGQDARSYDTNKSGDLTKVDADDVFAKGTINSFGKPVSRQEVGQRLGQAKQDYYKPKAGGEFEEAVVVPETGLPIARTMVGFWVNPRSQLTKDTEVMNDPRRLELAPGGTGRFVKATKPSVPQPAPLAEQRLFNSLIRPINEGTSIESTLRAIINDIGEPITSVYDTMKFQAKKYMENHGELGRGFRMVAAGVGGRWVQNMYIGRLHNELHDLTKYNTRRTVDLQEFLRGEENDGEIEMKRSFGNLANNLPPILARLGQHLNAPQLTKNAQRWMQNKAEYERYLMDLEAEGDEPDDEPVKIKPEKSNVIGQQNAQVDQIVNDVLSKIPKNIAGEIRNAIARAPNKLAALKQELDRHHVKMAEGATADMRSWFAGQERNLPFRTKSPDTRNYDYPKEIDDILKKIKNREGLKPQEFEYLKKWKARQDVDEDDVIGHMAKDLTGKGSPIAKAAAQRDKKREQQSAQSHGRSEGPKWGVAEGSGEAEAYKAHLIKTMPQMMNFLSKKVKGWTPGKEEMLGAIDTAYMVMKHTGDVKQAGKAMMDELNTLHRMSQGQQGVAEGSEKQQYLWHGSRQKIPMLEPRQSVDTGGAAGSNQNAIYATSDPKVAIAMGLTTPGSDTGMFPNDPQIVLFSGKIRKGENVYLHKLPMNGPDGKPQFVQGGNSREFHSITGVKGIKPTEIKAVPVDKYLNLIRTATPQDLELQKKYMKQQGVTEGLKQQYLWPGSRQKIPMYQSIKDEITEAFDYPYKLKWGKSSDGDVDASATLDDGNYLNIFFNQDENQDGELVWNVEFDRNYSQAVTGEGDAQRVFATVLSAIQTFIKKYKPLKLTFAASKKVDQGQNSQSRARLYDSLVQRYARAWGYKAFRADTGNLVVYEFSRIQKLKAVGEDYTGQFAKEGVAEARMSAAQRLWNAEQKQRAKSDASLARTPSSIPKPEPKKDEKIAELRAVEPDPTGYQKDLLTSPKNALVVDTPGDLDWYKLGQHYPSLGSDDPHEYGQSDSDMVIVPYSEKELVGLKQKLDRLKMRYKDIGGGHEQPEIHDKMEEKMLPKSAFAGSDKNKLGPAAHFTPKDAHVKRGQFVGGDAGSVDEEKQRLDPSCWKGYKKQGTKMKGDTRVNNCVKINEDVENIMDNLINKIIVNEAISNNRK